MFARLDRFAARDLLVGLWLLEIVVIFQPIPGYLWAAGIGLAVYAALSVPRLRAHTRVITLAIAIALLAIAGVTGHWEELVPAIGGALPFAAFLPTILLVRATAEASPEITEARHRFGAMKHQGRETAMLLGAHAMGGVLSIGTFPIVASLVAAEADPEERRRAALTALRGMNLSILWSPFFLGMAVALAYTPGATLLAVLPLGLGLAALGLVMALLLFGGRAAAAASGAALVTLRPVLPPVAVAAIVVVLVASVTPLDSIEAILVVVPVLCTLQLLRYGHRPSIAFTAAVRGLPRMRDEMTIALAAVTLGHVLAATPALVAPLTASLDAGVPVVVLILGGLTFILGSSMVGVHPMVSVTAVLVIYAGLEGRFSPAILAEMGLIGWSLGTMNSICSISVAICSGLFGVPYMRLAIGPNLAFAVLFVLVSSPVLAGLNGLLLER